MHVRNQRLVLIEAKTLDRSKISIVHAFNVSYKTQAQMHHAAVRGIRFERSIGLVIYLSRNILMVAYVGEFFTPVACQSRSFVRNIPQKGPPCVYLRLQW